ncbi:MAG TPA: type II toxin-antitoxin system VapC family toxin [Rhizomicrobium sp.]|jgi:ribonuclease VapC
MIAVDTSALMAIIFGEAKADACIEVLEAESDVLISAGTAAESLIVASQRRVVGEMTGLIEGLGFEVVSVTRSSALRIAEAYRKWGNGAHRAGLNFGDCFAYALAMEHSCPLLFVGDDFSRTDVVSVLK